LDRVPGRASIFNSNKQYIYILGRARVDVSLGDEKKIAAEPREEYITRERAAGPKENIIRRRCVEEDVY